MLVQATDSKLIYLDQFGLPRSLPFLSRDRFVGKFSYATSYAVKKKKKKNEAQACPDIRT